MYFAYLFSSKICITIFSELSSVYNYCVNKHHVVTVVFVEVRLKTGTEPVPKTQYIISRTSNVKFSILHEFKQAYASARAFIKRDMKLFQS